LPPEEVFLPAVPMWGPGVWHAAAPPWLNSKAIALGGVRPNGSCQRAVTPPEQVSNTPFHHAMGRLLTGEATVLSCLSRVTGDCVQVSARLPK
jgi:hypothetical protein